MKLRGALLGAGIAALVAAAPARADQTYLVSDTADVAGSCTGTTCPSLRAAITEGLRQGGVTNIVLPTPKDQGDYYHLNSALTIAATVNIAGTGAQRVTIKSDNPKGSRIFTVGAGQTLSLSGVTVSGGNAVNEQDKRGGDILVGDGGTLSLAHVRVTGGKATGSSGGGIAAGAATKLTIDHSLIDTNQASEGGGVFSIGDSKGAGNEVHVTDSTIAFNQATTASGIDVRSNPANVTTIDRSTIAFNQSSTNSGAAISTNDAEKVTVGSTIIAKNRGDSPQDSCVVANLVSTGGNIEDLDKCGFGTKDKVNTDAQFGSTQLVMDGGQTPLLPIKQGGPAVDFAGNCTGTDQRDEPRPQGAKCDSGAYELDHVPIAHIDGGPSGPTNSRNMQFTFSSDSPGATFECRRDGPAGAVGTFAACTSPKTYLNVPEGDYQFLVRAVDSVHTDTPVDTRTFTVDVTPPAAPVFTAPAEGSAQQSHTVNLTGTGELFATVMVMEGTNVKGMPVVNQGGTWSLQLTNVPDGPHTYTAIQTDAAGNSSGQSTLHVTVDNAAPDTNLLTNPGALTSSKNVSFTFSSTEGGPSFVCQLDPPGTPAACTSPQAYNALADGTYTFHVAAKDAAGNIDPTTADWTFTVDATAPAAPLLTAPADNSFQKTTSVTVTGTAESGATVTILDNGSAVDTTTTDRPGNWSKTLTAAEGKHVYTAKATDAAGNTSVASLTRTVTVDLTAPAAPAITAPGNNSFQKSQTVNLGGTAEAGSLVEVFDGATSKGTTTATAGTWSLQLTGVAEGPHVYTAKATDAAQNTSVASATRTVTVDFTAPAAPAITAPGNNSFQKTTTVALAGTAEAGSTVEIFEGATSRGTTVTAGDGTWSKSLTATEAQHVYTAKATDAAQNTSAASATRTVTVDLTAPTAPTITAPADGSFQKTTTVALAGTAEAGSTVEIFEGATSRGTTVTAGDGTWSKSLTATEAQHVYTAKATDAAQNTSAASATRTVTVDLTAPTAPTITAPANNSSQNVNTVALAGTAEPGSTVEIFEGAASRGTTTAAGDGSWNKTVIATEATHVYTAKATDAAQNTSAASATRTVTVDLTAPNAPAITAPGNNSFQKTQTVNLAGTAEAGSLVEVFEGAASRGTTTAAGDGTWSKAVIATEATHVYTAKATDAAQNTSAASATRTVTVDLTAPNAPAITAPGNNSFQKAQTVNLGGTAEAGSLVEVFDGATSKGTTTATGGTWSLQLTGVAEGAHVYTAKATDAAQNTSAASATRTVTVDLTAPAAPAFTAPADNSAQKTATVTLGGTAEPSSTVEVFEGTTSRGTVTAAGDGTWLLSLSGVSEATHVYTAKATDAAQNTSAASATRTVTVDLTAPNAPAITAPGNNSFQKTTTVALAGTAEAGATVEIFEGATSRGTTVTAGDGTWSKSLTATEATHVYTAKATDAAQNTSGSSASRTVTVDLTAPNAPAITAPGNNSSQNVTTVALAGTAEAGSTVEIFEGAASRGTTTAAGDGSWSKTVIATEATHVYTAKATDAAQNTSAASATRTVTVDLTAPNAPAITAPGNNSFQKTQTVNLAGTAEGGSTVEIFEGAASRGTTTAAGDGTWTAQLTSVTEGAHVYTAQATDAAKNTSLASATRTVTVDLTRPNAPVVSTPTESALLGTKTIHMTGTAESGARIDVSDSGGASGTATATGGNWSLDITVADQGAHTLSVTATDAAGNTSTATSRHVTVDTGAPDPPVITAPADGSSQKTTTVAFAGTAEPGSTVKVFEGTTQRGLAAQPGADGKWAISFTAAAGTHVYTATATDAAGNPSDPSATRTVTVDLTAPAAPVFTAPADNSFQKSTTVPLAGTAEANAAVEIFDNGISKGTVFAGADGKWSGPLNGVGEGTHVYTAKATDAAQNTSVASATRTVTVDLTAPNAPVVTAPAEGAALASKTIHMTGTAESGARIDVSDSDVATGHTTAANGAWSLDVTVANQGDHSFSVTATDAALNVSVATVRHVTVDTGAPDPPVITAPAEGALLNSHSVQLTGTAENGADVEVFEGIVSRGTAHVADGTWTLIVDGVADGVHSYTAKATDAAHNASDASAARTLTVDTTPPPADVVSGPTGTTTSTAPEFAFNSPDAGSTFECRLTGPGQSGPFAPCVSPKDFSGLAPGDYTFFVRAIDAAGNPTAEPASRSFTVAVVQQATPTPTPTATPTPEPTPTFQQSVVVQPAGGKVLVRKKGSKTFVALDQTTGIPLGSEVDTKHGKVELSSVPKRGGPVQTALFYGGIFVVTQTGGITLLKLSEPLAACPSAHKASAAAKKKKPKTRSLWGDGHGAFRTQGKYSAATVRGTNWFTQDSCAGTLTKVKSGVVEVNDFVRHKKQLLRKGKSYLAHPNKRR